jgi:epoxyqueuosine reductase
MLINEELGSWLFLGVIITTLDLEPTVRENESLPADLCGQCRLCIDACPTDAITEPYLLDARRCISYLTIELRGAIPEELRPGMGRMIFGCDICQDVCPWNRNAPVTPLTEFLPRRLSTMQSGVTNAIPAAAKTEDGTLFSPPLESLASLNEADFREIFRGSPIKRAKWRGLIRNACVALGNSRLAHGSPQHKRIINLLENLAASPDALIAEHADWALSRLRERNASERR